MGKLQYLQGPLKLWLELYHTGKVRSEQSELSGDVVEKCNCHEFLRCVTMRVVLMSGCPLTLGHLISGLTAKIQKGFKDERFPRLLMCPLALVCLLVSGFATTARAGDEWRTVDPAELALKDSVVEKNADAEALFWEVRMDDVDAGDLDFTNYTPVKVIPERGKESQLTFSRKLVQNAATIPADQYSAVRALFEKIRALNSRQWCWRGSSYSAAAERTSA